jgi:hypothetical protein
MMRIMRANFIDYMQAEFATTARAKGVAERVIMFKHVLRNAINPLITAFGYSFASLLSGALLVENVMNYPGLGQLIYEALIREDQYVVMAGVLIGVVMLVFGNLFSDLLLGWMDPRIRLEGGAKNGASGQKANLVWLVLIGIIALQILLEVFAPSLLGMIGLILKYIGLLLVGLLAVACVLLVGYIVVTLFRRLIGGVLRRPMGAAALAVLTLLYCGALFAPVISPYPITQQNLVKPYHPPTELCLERRCLCMLSSIKKKLLVRLPTSILRMRPRQSFGSRSPSPTNCSGSSRWSVNSFSSKRKTPQRGSIYLVLTQRGAIYLAACYTALRSRSRLVL